MSDENVITTDHPLNGEQQGTLAALLDVIVPASEDGLMPSAKEMDLVAYIKETAEDFLPILVVALDNFQAEFSSMTLSERYPIVESFSKTQAEVFEGLLYHTYCCYYQDDRALVGIGLTAGPPFPNGNTLEPGDLSLLDPVVESSRGYRK